VPAVVEGSAPVRSPAVRNYQGEPCWFRGLFEIREVNGARFADRGDNDSLIFTQSGSVLGILCAVSDSEAYAYPIEKALKALDCTML
jgi:hypothetical protein